MPVLKIARSISSSLTARSAESTRAELSTQWQNPSDVLSVLLIIGGDIVQSALAQMSGGVIVPVCFSFGWVAYGFTSVSALVGKGRLMPEPDYPCKVINLELDTGHPRENKSWMVGRILRDLELQFPLDEEAICVKIFDALDGEDGRDPAGHCTLDSLWYGSLLTMLVQCGIAAIPCGLYGNWGILMITVIGTLLALLTGALPQWRAEKYAARTNSRKSVALTVGNGSRYVIIIRGNGHTLDFEDLASSQVPKVRRSWNGVAWFRERTYGTNEKGEKIVVKENPAMYRGLPLDFWATRAICITIAICWLALLIAVAGLKRNTWYLLAVGAIGMAQNGIAATVSRADETRGIHIKESLDLRGIKVMDVFMDLECLIPGAGRHLVHEYYPSGTREKHGEKAWWDGRTEEYDGLRMKDKETRRVPLSMSMSILNGGVRP